MFIDPVLERLPQSTKAWSCPWFKMIVLGCVVAILFGILAGTTVGTVWAVAGALLLGRELDQRDHDVASCDA